MKILLCFTFLISLNSNAQNFSTAYSSLKKCFDFLENFNTIENGNFFYSKETKTLLLNDSNGVYAFNENGAYFHKYENDAVMVGKNNQLPQRCLKVFVPQKDPEFFVISLTLSDKNSNSLASWGRSEKCGGFKGDRNIISPNTVYETVLFRDNQNPKYYNKLSESLRKTITTFETDESKLAPFVIDIYKDIINNNFLDCSNTKNNSIDDAAQYMLKVLNQNFSSKQIKNAPNNSVKKID